MTYTERYNVIFRDSGEYEARLRGCAWVRAWCHRFAMYHRAGTVPYRESCRDRLCIHLCPVGIVSDILVSLRIYVFFI